MYHNLDAEMARIGITNRHLSLLLRKSARTIRDKRSGKYPFTLQEARKIRDAFFPGMNLDFLFSEYDDRTA